MFYPKAEYKKVMDADEERLMKKYTLSQIEEMFASLVRAKKISADFKSFGYIPIALLGFFGNIVIIVNKIRIERMSTYHFLIILLAIIDFCAITVGSIGSIAFKENTLIHGKWFPLFKRGSTTTSYWMLVMLSYERYRSIVHPFKERFKKMPVFCFGICMLVISHLVHVPSLICLLYTSPSPRDGLLSRMPSSA